MSFNEKVVLITGGGSGIGAACALHFAKEKALLSLVDINANNLAEISNQMKEVDSTSDPLLITANINSDPKRIINETIEKYGRLDVVINNAGIAKLAFVGNITTEDYDNIMATNLRGAVFLSQFAIPHLIKTKGNIVNVSSAGSVIPMPNNAAYCISKAALNHFTRCSALELAPTGVRVNTISPGVVNTNLFRTCGKNEIERHSKKHPIGRIAEPEEIARAIAFLANEQSSFITGVNLPVDGGMRLQFA